MGAIDWTEECREKMRFANGNGYTDFPFESGDTLDIVYPYFSGDGGDEEDEDEDEC